METKTYRLDNLFRLSKVEYLLQSMLLGGSTPLTGGSLRAGFIKPRQKRPLVLSALLPLPQLVLPAGWLHGNGYPLEVALPGPSPNSFAVVWLLICLIALLQIHASISPELKLPTHGSSTKRLAHARRLNAQAHRGGPPPACTLWLRTTGQAGSASALAHAFRTAGNEANAHYRHEQRHTSRDTQARACPHRSSAVGSESSSRTHASERQ